MKKIILITIVIGFVIQSRGQEQKEIIKEGNYFFDFPSSESLKNLRNLSNLNKSTTIDSIKEEVSGTKYRVTVKAEKDKTIEFIFWQFKDTAKHINKMINNADPEYDSRVTYTLSENEFKEVTKILYDRVEWRVGFFTVPFKLRISNFDFESNLNLGTNIGGKIRWNREVEDGLKFEPILGIGLSSIKLDESNSTITSSSNLSAITINAGLLTHISKDINLGLLLGFDYLANKDQTKYGWIYNGKGWIGLGINVSFSTESEKNKGNQTKNK